MIALVCGRPGPVATHTPEVCYGANGYLVGDKKSVAVEGDGPARFWTSDAVRTRVSEETKVRLYWAWNGGKGWIASRDARIQFPRHNYPVLHKLYVLREISGSKDASAKAVDATLDETTWILSDYIQLFPKPHALADTTSAAK